MGRGMRGNAIIYDIHGYTKTSNIYSKFNLDAKNIPHRHLPVSKGNHLLYNATCFNRWVPVLFLFWKMGCSPNALTNGTRQLKWAQAWLGMSGGANRRSVV